jgi:hypothetical protein
MVKDPALEKTKTKVFKNASMDALNRKIYRIESLKWIDDAKQHELNILYEEMNKLLQQDIRYR